MNDERPPKMPQIVESLGTGASAPQAGWQSVVDLLERFKKSPMAMRHLSSLLGRIHGELAA